MPSLSDDLTKIVSSSGLVFLGKIGTIVLSFIAHILLVRYLSPDMFGTLTLALTIVSVCVGFAAVGMDQANARFISISNRSESVDYAKVSLSIVIITGTISTILVYIFSNEISIYFGESQLSYLLKIFSLIIFLRLLSKTLHGIVRGFELTRIKVVHFDILPLLVSLVVLSYFVSQEKIIIGAVLYYFLQPIFRFILLLGNIQSLEKWSLTQSIPDRDKFSELLWFAWPLAFESLVVVFLGSVDILMLGRLTSSESVGEYRSIQPLAKNLVIFLQVLTFIYLPIASQYFDRGEFDRLDRVYKTTTRWISLLTFPLFLYYVLFGEPLIRILFGVGYIDASVPLAILSIGMYSRVFIGPNGMTIQAINRTREDLAASFFGLSVNIGLNYILIPNFGISGAAVATLCGYFAYNIIELIIIYRHTNIIPFHPDQLLPLIPTTILWLLVTLVSSPVISSLFGLALYGICILFTHILSISITTGFTKEDMMILDELLSN